MTAAQRATPKQMGFIHGLAGKAGLDQEARRGFLQRHAGVASTKELTAAQASDIIKKLQPLAGQASGAVAGLDSPVARKLRALWIAGYDLGLVRDRTDRAMLAFLERQCGVSHTRFLAEPGAGSSAIEALKAWLERDAGVDWPERDMDAWLFRAAVVKAQWRRLEALGEVHEIEDASYGALALYVRKVANLCTPSFQTMSREQWDRVQNALGKRLRGALDRRHGAAR